MLLRRPIPGRTAARAAAVVAVSVPFALLGACGGDDDTAATFAGTTSSAPDPNGPVTIEHAFGSTTIEAEPERIVTLGAQWTDVVLAMGRQPVGYLADPLAGPGGRFPWESELSAEATGIEATDSVPLEQVAALQPDLILVTFLADEKAVYDKLAAIAPTVGLLGGRQVDTWQDLTTVAGRIFRQPEKATAVIDGVERLLDETAADLPGLAGKSFALANYVPGDSIYVVADPKDGSSVFFQQLGMEIDPEILATGDGVSGRAELSLEQAGLLDADLLVLFSNDGDPHDLVGYDQLPAVVDGAVAEVEYAPVVGLNTPSPLSIPYSLETVRPALEAAADG